MVETVSAGRFYTHYCNMRDSVHVVEIDGGGKVHYVKYPAMVDLHIEANDLGGPGVFKGWRDMAGNPLSTFRLPKSEAKRFIQTAEHMDVPVFGRVDPAPQVIAAEFVSGFEPKWRHVRPVYLDIETTLDHRFIRSVSVRRDGRSTVWGMKPYTPTEQGGIWHYVQCADEQHMLHEFVKWWKEDIPTIVAHINGDAFDIVILVNRIVALLGKRVAQQMAPWGWVKDTYLESNTGRKVPSYELVGVVSLDWALLYKKFVDIHARVKLESFALEAIAQHVLGYGKLEYDGDLDDLYENDPSLFYEYNAHDNKLVEDLENKLHLIELVFRLAMDSKSNLIDCVKTVKMWDNTIANELAKRHIAVPNAEIEAYDDAIRGGWVLEPTVGRHEWVCGVDYRSLYPSLIETFNISPDTKVERGPPLDGHIYTALGVNFLPKGKRVGFLTAMITARKQERAEIRRQMKELEQEEGKDSPKYKFLDIEQTKIKILINSLYGALLNMYFRWFDVDLGESITLTGQHCTKTVIEALEENGFQVVAGDTDSAFIALGPYMAANKIEPSLEAVEGICDSIINPLIQQSINEMCRDFGVTGEITLQMEADVFARTAIWSGKKNYILATVGKDGKDDEIIVKGLRARKKNTPPIHRAAIMDMVKRFIIDEEDYAGMLVAVEEHVERCKALHPSELAQSITLHQRPDAYIEGDTWRKRTPQQYKAAIAHNRAALNGISIVERDSVHLFHLKRGGHGFIADVVANAHCLLSESELRAAFDYETVLEKNFKEPLRQIVEAIGWDIPKPPKPLRQSRKRQVS